ncbi:suppressor of IKBKE 1 isoform X2 [Cinclus cinclus]|uniref:suppressor of IKBKE 1 isoform X2 n=1 Tax=Cinclus cinclus TaxID=127875 RepID=UPI002E148CCB
MSCTIDKILTDARTLLERLKEHDTAAESLIDQSAVLHRRVAAMREAGAGCADQGPGPAAERPDPSRLRPHVVLAQENTQIRDLQQENRELWVSLEEHQDALELIMSKYRKQMLQLLEGRKREEAEPVLKAHQANSGSTQVVTAVPQDTEARPLHSPGGGFFFEPGGDFTGLILMYLILYSRKSKMSKLLPFLFSSCNKGEESPPKRL